MTMRALMEIALVDGSAVVANGVWNVERKIITTFLGCHLEQLAILLLGEVLLKIHVEGRTACEVLNIWCTMELELLYDICVGVLNYIEIAVVAIARNEISVFPIPLRMLYSNILGGNHLAVEQYVLGAI